MFTYTYEPRYGDYKNQTQIKTSSLLDMVQDVAVRHSETCGYGMDVLRGLSLAWLIRGVKVRFEKEISPKLPITVHTGVKKMRGLISERCSLIEQDGSIVGKVVAEWFLFDSDAMRPCKISPEIISAYPISDFSDEFFNYKKTELSEAERISAVKVSNKEIDTNNHLNNCKGAEILMDALPFDFFFTDMNVLYKKSAYLDEELFLCRKETKNGFYVHLEDCNGEVYVAATFEK